jgi:peptide-methionine (S)-S-oxide reductase
MSELQTATLGGGCFWCVEAVMQPLKGVREVVSGYMGGKVKNPSYREVCGGRTGHAEVVQVHFDPDEVSFRDLLYIFFATHDPTTLNRQGADTGTQYRSAIFYHDDEQKRIAEEVIADLEAQGTFGDPIVTEVTAAQPFYRAEEVHQNYFAQNPAQPYCQAVIAPKVAKLRRQYLDRLKAA